MGIKVSESDIQAGCIKAIKLAFPGAVIIANPLSELQLHYRSEKAKMAALAKAKKAGWERSQCDVIVIYNDAVVGLEFKTPKEYPFRAFRGGGMWIDKTKSEEKREHILAQAYYLHRIMENGGFGFFVCSVEQVLRAMQFALSSLEMAYTPENEQVKQYDFRYSLSPNCHCFYFPTS